MKLNYLFNLFLISIPLVLSSACDDIDKSLLNSIQECTTNEKGIITGLAINIIDLTEEQINKLLSNELTDLTINYVKTIFKADELEDELVTLGKNTLKQLTNLKSLNIGNIKVTQDSIDEISTLDNLEELTFKHSYFDESIKFESLGNLKKLNKLNVQIIPEDYLTINQKQVPVTFPEGLIKSNKGIKELSLELLYPVNINKEDFPNLEKLNLSWYYSTERNFDSSFVEQFDKLTDLEISCSEYSGSGWDSDEEDFFCDFNADLSKLKNIKSLSTKKIQITEELMNGVISLTKLEKLFFDDFNILDEEFLKKLNSLETLSTLYLGNNHNNKKYHGRIFNVINDINLSLPNLRNITLKDDSFEVIPEFIFSYKDLEYLDLSGNSLKTVNEKLSNLENLKHLDLSSNYLISVPKQIINLKKLEYLNLNYNDIVDESPEYLNDFKNLKYFYIEDNTQLIGKVVNNENLVECSYDNHMAQYIYNLCIPKDVKETKCLLPELEIKKCVDYDSNVSTDGLCGKDHGRCPNGQCCGKDGKCSTSRESCLVSKDCQMKYGSCINECQEINEYLVNNNTKSVRCTINEEGRATYIMLDEYGHENIYQKMYNQLPNLHSLEKLYLIIDYIENMDLSLLKKLEKLNDLTLYGSLTYIPEDIFSLTNLEKLEFDYTLSEISPKIGELKNLKELSLGCKVNEMPVEFGNLTNLEILNLRGENISNYEDFIGKLINLKNLSLSFNKIYDLPKEIGNLSKLETFDLSYNKINSLPKEFGNLKNLKKLNLSNNNISELPKEFENLINLEILKLEDNSLTKFPEQIGKLKKLEEINLLSNKINDEIPKSYNDLPNLVEFIAYYNDDIRGETLTNKSLVKCGYHVFSLRDEDEVYNLCRHGNETCLEEDDIKYYKLCDNSSNSSTTITESKSTTIDKTTTTTTSSKAEPTVIKGRCGKDYGNCKSGECCSKYGWCGRSNEHCDVSKGCQSEFGECKNGDNKTTITTKKTTTTSIKPESTTANYRCGKQYGNAKCSHGECCSKYGWCGKSDEHCDVSKGCQSEFGKCNSTTPKPKPNAEGKCGERYGKCPAGQCCSKYGWCGKTDDYCSIAKGCQTKFGHCAEDNTSKEGKCGEGYGKCPSGQCCSKYGWCGTSSAYCDSGCQSKYGKCN